MNKLIFQIILIISIAYSCISDIGCNTHATLLRQVEREGFHLDIHSLVELVVDVETAPVWENCSLVLREKIPDSFYVNPDQLLDLSRSGQLYACTPDIVDVETPQHLSNGHTAYLYGSFERSENLIYSHLKLPLHLRYQKPRHGGGYSTAAMKSPTLLIRCKSDVVCDDLPKSKASCFLCSKKMCDWMRIPYKTNVQNFTVSVPVGNLSHLPFVTFITYLLTFGGCFYVLLAVVNYRG